MPKVLELKAADQPGSMWVRIDMPGPQGEVSLWTKQELDRREAMIKQAIIEDIYNYMCREKE